MSSPTELKQGSLPEPVVLNGAVPAPAEKLSAKIVRNTIANAVGRFWWMALGFVLTPYIVGKLGDERFGIWAFLGVFVGYFAVVDLGIAPAVIKYVAGYYTSRDFERLNRAVNSAFFAVVFLMGVFCLVGVVFSRSFLHLFKISPQYYSEAWFALIGFFILMIGQGSLSVFQGILSGLQRMDLQNLISMGTSIPYVLMVFLLLGHGYGLPGLICANALTFVLNFILSVVCTRRVCPQFRFSPRLFHWKSVKELLHYGIQMQINNVSALLVAHGDKIMIGFFLNMSMVTAFELGYRLAWAARTLPTFLLPALMPAAAEADAKKDHGQLQRMFDLGSRYLALATLPCMTFLIVAAPLGMMAWMKEYRPESILAARVLAVAYLVGLLGGVGTSIARGVGRPDLENRPIPIHLIVNFGLGIPLIIKLGFWGPLVATLISAVVGNAYLFYLLHSELKLDVGRLYRHGLAVPALGSVVACLVTAGASSALAWTITTPRLILLVYLLLLGLVFFATYGLVIWLCRFSGGEVKDWDLVKSGLNMVSASAYGMLRKTGWSRGSPAS